LSWGGGLKRWVGTDAKRFSTLFCNGISLYAAHLPLDAHPELGNNAVLSSMIGLEQREKFFCYDGVDIGFSGILPQEMSLESIAGELASALDCNYLLRGSADRLCRKAAVVSGGGGIDSIFEAAAKGCDLLITGEMEHIMHHAAKESNVSIIALGHYASETTGPRAMMEFIRTKCGIEVEFLDAPTGL
jgi:dinuclear metal center YbgI/SA1388 family protein